MRVGETLYQRDSKGKERTWWVTVDGADITVHYGLVGGKIATKTTTAKPKNTGKANATTAEEQAISEARSKWTKQVEREDYHWEIDKAGQQLRPMLARDYTKVAHQVDWQKKDWYVQPKLDGLRLTYGWRHQGEGKPELLTRKGETYVVEHIAKEADKLIEIINNKLEGTGKILRGLDGELYRHGLPLNQIVSRAKKYKKGETEELRYHLFDLVIEGMGYADRCLLLLEALTDYLTAEDHQVALLVNVLTLPCHEEITLKKLHGEFAVQGYEGIMLRDADSEYKIGERPNCLFKYKEFHDAEYKIIDVWEDKNGNAMLTLDNPKGEGEHATFNCTPKRTHDERKAMLNEDLVGKWIKVKYQALTEYNVPEFPVGLEIRECDEDGNPVE